MRKLYIDMDNTMNDFSNHFVYYVNKLGYKYDLDLLDTYHIENGIIAPEGKTQNDIKEEVFKVVDFWYTIPILDNVVDSITKLSKHFDISIYTLPWRKEPAYQNIKSDWVSKHFSQTPVNVEFAPSSKKWLYIDSSAVIIDDNPSILMGCRQKGINTIGYHQGYNKDIHVDLRMDGWNPKAIDTIIKVYGSNT